MPHTAKIVDDITIVKTVNTDAINHDPASRSSRAAASSRAGRAWVPGSAMDWQRESESAGVVVMLSQAQALNPDQPLFSRLWGSGFLPSNHQGASAFARGATRCSICTTRKASIRQHVATC